ncbi:MAG: hypothetical protein IPG32_11470 [Saprospirales bacterium]|nr:hypothetical protein [Saprospirales bacterium]
MNLFQKLLWRSENRWQLIGAGLGTAMGLVLILGAFQLYLDVNRLLNKDEGADPAMSRSTSASACSIRSGGRPLFRKRISKRF